MKQDPTTQLSSRVCDFVASAQWTDVPIDVRHELKRSLLNYFAVGFAGATDPTIEIVVNTLSAFAANAQAGLIGRSERTDVLNAAALNAMSANVFDFDDTHERTVIHPTGPVAAALLAHAQLQPLDGADFLHALLLGIEIECRVGNAISPRHYARGWHITSTCGVLGAAMAVGRVLQLTPQQLKWALGSASNQACGLVETLGTMAKSTSVGNAARNGLLSALLAARNFTGPEQPLEGQHGFLQVMGESPDLSCITEGLGQHWEVQGNSYKPYPCGVVLNPVIEACLELAHQEGMQQLLHTELVAIELTGHPLLRQRTDRPVVTTGRASQVSAQHAVAASLLKGRAGLTEFSDAVVQDPAVRALGQCLHFIDDASYGIDAAKVTLQFKNHASVSRHIAHARGSVKHPLSDAEIEEKFLSLSSARLNPSQAQTLIDAIWQIETMPNVAALMQMAQVSPRHP
jgi:2-methylcitrate dehydratase PrpD